MAEGRTATPLIFTLTEHLQMDLKQTFRSPKYCIAQMALRCPFCGMATRVAAILLPVGHELLDEEEGQESRWQAVGATALLFFVTELSGGSASSLRQLAPGFACVRDRWSNHCEHCQALLDDQDLHCEPGDTFVPMDTAQGSKIRLVEIDQPIEVSAAGYSLQPEFLPIPRPA